MIENIEEDVFRELLCYFMTGSCNIHPLNIVGLACAAEYFDVPDLRQACLDHLICCLSSKILCQLLNQLEKHLTCQTAKSMLLTVSISQVNICVAKLSFKHSKIAWTFFTYIWVHEGAANISKL